MNEGLTILVQGGAVGVALACIILVAQLFRDTKEISKMNAQLHRETMSAVTNAIISQAQAITSNTEVIRALKETIDRKM